MNRFKYTDLEANLLDGGAVQILHPKASFNFEKFYLAGIIGDSLNSLTLNLKWVKRLEDYKQNCRPWVHETIFDSNEGCILQYWLKEFISQCNCVPFIFDQVPNVPYCDPFDLVECFLLNKTNFRHITDKTALDAEPQCSIPYCVTWDYDPKVTSVPMNKNVLKNLLDEKFQTPNNDSFTVVQVFYPDLSYTEIRQISVYTVDSFISNVGGQIGLWLGMSALTVVQACTYIYQCLRVLRKRLLTYLFYNSGTMKEVENCTVDINLNNASFTSRSM